MGYADHTTVHLLVQGPAAPSRDTRVLLKASLACGFVVAVLGLTSAAAPRPAVVASQHYAMTALPRNPAVALPHRYPLPPAAVAAAAGPQRDLTALGGAAEAAGAAA
eukprot:CAMPEP_0174349966 /NCGR_PEP_ID=MMETSP0811_2-20130205/6869_1 /TAXON_ID=73025 ORGANISM="Eutreptiella gymnastica-like, Strain CCMP1594" /NCGR_SAMPLE_ID=MMETSP0811_2 /ASSEMBLY_ACC=CAM_ASM_000667 /LENGTH=106 /DNA_ID=CAMNT_0015477801 /DNA_START=21 /DNA_END=337 /DNA_ORIENTATION=-